MLLLVTVCAGVPAGDRAFGVAQRTLAELATDMTGRKDPL